MALSTNKIFIIFAVGCSALILINLSLGHFHHDVTSTNNRQHVDSSFMLQNSNSNSNNNEEQRMAISSQEQHNNNNRQINVVDRSFTHSKSVVVDDENKWWLGKIRRPDGAPLTHPYMGARHKNGSVGLLVNPSPSRLQFVDITKVSNVICSTAPSSTEVKQPTATNRSHLLQFKSIEYCGDIKWLDTQLTCNERVQYLVSKKHMSQRDAKTSLLETNECSCSSLPADHKESLFQYGIEGKGGRRVLEKVRVAHHDESIEKVDKRSKRSRPSRILCLVYSVHLPSNGKNDQIANHANLRAIAQTWGQK